MTAEFGVLDAVVLGGAGIVYGYAQLRGWLEEGDDSDEVDDVQAARRDYVDGNISETEMERRLELALDDDRQELRRRVEKVSGIGPDTSAAIAEEFGSVSDLAAADQEEIADRVHGVGTSTAEAVRQVVE